MNIEKGKQREQRRIEERNIRENAKLARDLANYELELQEDMTSEFEQSISNKNFFDFYTTAYIASDIGTEQSHTDSDVNMHTSTPTTNIRISNKERGQPLQRISNNINAPLHLRSPLALSNNGIFFNDDL